MFLLFSSGSIHLVFMGQLRFVCFCVISCVFEMCTICLHLHICLRDVVDDLSNDLLIYLSSIAMSPHSFQTLVFK